MIKEFGRPFDLHAIVAVQEQITRLMQYRINTSGEMEIPNTNGQIAEQHLVIDMLREDLSRLAPDESNEERFTLLDSMYSSDAWRELSMISRIVDACWREESEEVKFAILHQIPWGDPNDEASLKHLWKQWTRKDESSRWPESPIDVLTRIIESIEKQIRRLNAEYWRTLDRKDVFLAHTMNPPLGEWLPVSLQFNPSDDYRMLPPIARNDFEEAARCFVFQQYSAGAMLAMRGAEATLREFVYRLTGYEATQKDNWGKLVDELNKRNGRGTSISIDPTLIAELDMRREQRNTLFHPNIFRDATRTDWDEAEGYFDEAKNLARKLVHTWISVGKRLSIYVAHHTNKIEIDNLVALWLLAKKGGGIGRFRFSTDKYELPDRSAYDRLIGVTIPSQGSYANEVATELGVVSTYSLLLACCHVQAVADKSITQPISKKNLDIFLEGILFYHESDLEKAYLQALGLLDLADMNNVYVNAQAWDQIINKSSYKRYWKLGEAKEKAETASQIGQLGMHQIIVTASDKTCFTELARIYYERGYKVIGLIDVDASSVYIESVVEPKHIVERLNARALAEIFSYSKQNSRESENIYCVRSQQKVGGGIDIEALYECIIG